MKKAEFINRENLTSFFLNFLAVVLGIVITFGGESLISARKERNNLKNCLELVSSELQNNKEYLISCDSLLKREVEAALFLIRYEKDYTKAPKDSMGALCNVPLMLDEISIYTDAFELLKNSGVLTKIRDKQLALDIFRIYGALQNDVDYINMFYDHKLKYLEPAMNSDVKALLSSDNVTAVGLWSEMARTDEGRQFLREILRFLSSYNPYDLYEAVDLAISEISGYTL